MLAKRARETGSVEAEALEESPVEYCGARKSMQRATQPFLVGHAKSRLRTVQDVGRQSAAHGVAQHDLLLPAAHLQRRGHTDRQRDHAIVQQRHSGFDSMGHGRPIDFGEKLRRQLQRDVRQQHLLYGIDIRETARRSADTPRRDR